MEDLVIAEVTGIEDRSFQGITERSQRVGDASCDQKPYIAGAEGLLQLPHVRHDEIACNKVNQGAEDFRDVHEEDRLDDPCECDDPDSHQTIPRRCGTQTQHCDGRESPRDHQIDPGVVEFPPDRPCFGGPSDAVIERADSEGQQRTDDIDAHRHPGGEALAVVDQGNAGAQHHEEHRLVEMPSQGRFFKGHGGSR